MEDSRPRGRSLPDDADDRDGAGDQVERDESWRSRAFEVDETAVLPAAGADGSGPRGADGRDGADDATAVLDAVEADGTAVLDVVPASGRAAGPAGAAERPERRRARETDETSPLASFAPLLAASQDADPAGDPRPVTARRTASSVADGDTADGDTARGHRAPSAAAQLEAGRRRRLDRQSSRSRPTGPTPPADGGPAEPPFDPTSTTQIRRDLPRPRGGSVPAAPSRPGASTADPTRTDPTRTGEPLSDPPRGYDTRSDPTRTAETPAGLTPADPIRTDPTRAAPAPVDPARTGSPGGRAGDERQAEAEPESSTTHQLRFLRPRPAPEPESSTTHQLRLPEGGNPSAARQARPDLADRVTYRDPGQEGAEGPVFVDSSGRRSRKWRWAGWAAVVACIGFGASIVVALSGDDSSAPDLRLPGATAEDNRAPSASPTASVAPSADASPSTALSERPAPVDTPTHTPSRTPTAPAVVPSTSKPPSPSHAPSKTGTPPKSPPASPTGGGSGAPSVPPTGGQSGLPSASDSPGFIGGIF